MALSLQAQEIRKKNLELFKSIAGSRGKAAAQAAVILYNKAIDTAKSFLSAELNKLVPLDKLDDIVTQNFGKLGATSVLSSTNNVLSKVQGPLGSLGFLKGGSGDTTQLMSSMQVGISKYRKEYDRFKNESDRNDFAAKNTKSLVKKLSDSVSFLDAMKINLEEV